MSAEDFDLDPNPDADGIWFETIRRMSIAQERGVHAVEAYIQQCLECETNGQAAILPTSEELDLILTNTDYDTRNYVIDSLVLLVEFRGTIEYAESLLTRFSGGSNRLMDAEDDEEMEEEEEGEEEEEESLGIQFTAGQVADFIQTLARVEISRLQADDAKCPICKLDYGKQRGETAISESATNSDQGLPGEDEPEQPVRLSCGHVFGEWCIKTWLLEQRATCPICRFRFEPIV